MADPQTGPVGSAARDVSHKHTLCVQRSHPETIADHADALVCFLVSDRRHDPKHLGRGKS